LYCPPNIICNKIKEEEMGESCGTQGGEQKCRQVLAKKLEGRKPLGRPRCRWEDSIMKDLKEIRLDDVGWICEAQERDKWWAYLHSVNYGEFLK
jgi:hypothetical protein